MFDEMAIGLSGVGKMYKIYPSRLDNFLDALGMARLMPWRRIKAREFWALRDINFELKKGSRLGIIGRNGAGKSTLLKLITGNLAPTEGEVRVNGQVQALLEAGAGFHPEFTGYENIRASLIYQGFSPKEIEAAIQDITEFTELGQFLAQPFKTYSAGMQARLVFATATTLKPDILIIDEILGAGDAYFANKSSERMKDLVEESGASVLLVSHSMAQILQYCEECIWVERGRIVMQGPSMKVVNAYEAFIQSLEDRRLKAKNRKRLSTAYNSAQSDGYGDALVLAFQLQGASGTSCDIAEISLLKNQQIEETLKIGDVQDATGWPHMALVSLEGSDWSEPRRGRDSYSRSLTIQPNSSVATVGYAVFYAYAMFDEAQYAFQIRYRCCNSAQLTLTITRNGSVLQNPVDLPTGDGNWTEWMLPLAGLHSKNGSSPEGNIQDQSSSIRSNEALVRWPGEGSLTIEQVLLLGVDDQERTVFSVGEPLILSMTILAHRSGQFDLVSGATLFRLDGIFVSNLVSQPIPLDLGEGETRELRLTMTPLNLGDGHYVFSLSIFEQTVSADTRYDLIARGFEFQVVGNPTLVSNAIFQHSGNWTLVAQPVTKEDNQVPPPIIDFAKANEIFYPFILFDGTPPETNIPTLQQFAAGIDSAEEIMANIIAFYDENKVHLAEIWRESNLDRVKAFLVMNLIHISHIYGYNDRPDYDFVDYIKNQTVSHCRHYSVYQSWLLDAFGLKWQHVIIPNGFHGWVEVEINKQWEIFDATANVWIDQSSFQLMAGGKRKYRLFYTPCLDQNRPDARTILPPETTGYSYASPASLRTHMPGLGIYFDPIALEVWRKSND